jgi:hypothetical protein
LLFLSLLFFLQISVSNWVSTKLLLLWIGSKLITYSCLWPSRFLFLIILWFTV